MSIRLKMMIYLSVVAYLGILFFIPSTHTQQCEEIPNTSRFNCYPEQNVTEQACIARNCCWSKSSKGSRLSESDSITVPRCYYASNFPYYKMISSNETEFGQRINLNLSGAIYTQNSATSLTVDFRCETRQRLRIQIYDSTKPRYQVPLPVPDVPTKADDTDYKIVIEKSEPFAIKVTRSDTGIVLFDSSVAPLIFADQFIKISTLLPGPLLYGLGEHRQPLLINITDTWERLTFYTRDFPPIQNINLYGVHPFYINLEQQDEDTNFHGQFLLNSNAMDVELQPLPAISYTTIGGIIDLYIFTGPTVQDVIKQYWEVIGKPSMPPYWSLGFHLSRFGYENSSNLRATIQRMHNADFPYDVQWTDVDTMDSYLDFTYDDKRFGDLQDIIRSLQSIGQHYVTVINPTITADPSCKTYPQFDEGVQLGVFIRNTSNNPIIGQARCGIVGFPDFTNPNTSGWWSRLLAKFHDSISFDGIWLNMNEPSNLVDGSVDKCTNDSLDNPPFTPHVFGNRLGSRTLCPSAQQYLSSHYNLHSMYGHFQAQVTYEALASLLSKRPFVLSRSTFAGSGQYAAHWTGDNRSTFRDMYFSISTILSFNMFGITHSGADVCGFGLDASEELCIRWMQLGAFYPFMRNHNDRGQKDQDPASFSWEAQQMMKQALLMRYSLIPFWYTLHYEAAIKSQTIVQPLFFRYPNDPNTYNIDQQFLVGQAILISPALFSNITIVRAYFPQDVWYEYSSGIRQQSVGTFVDLNTPLQKINVHIRGGVILPMQLPGSNLILARANSFQLLVALSEFSQASGNLFWDAGDEINWNDTKEFNYFEFTITNSNTLTLSPIVVGYHSTTMRLDLVKVLGLSQSVTNVTVNGEYYNNFIYNFLDQTLSIHSLDIDMLEPTVQTITWITSIK